MVEGHECSAWCRPEEGLHCHVSHLWEHPGLLPIATPAEAVAYANDIVATGGAATIVGGKSYPLVRYEHAPEVPAESWQVANARALAARLRPLGRDAVHVCAVLVWFRVPVEVLA